MRKENEKGSYSYIELKNHIELCHPGKSILITGPHFYQVVTRVNKSTIQLWIDFINPYLKDKITKITWLVSQKNYRRELEQKHLTPFLPRDKMEDKR